MRLFIRGASMLLFSLLFSAESVPADPGAAEDAQPLRFLVAETGTPTHGDSYVIALTDADSIAHARRLIADGPSAGRPIVSARVAAGADGINRNVLAPGAPAWNWHVTELIEFADFAAEIFDGWPTFIENDVPAWIENTEGQIGFWNYTVIAELPQGDYDADLDVDADDYRLWRNSYGEPHDRSADGTGNGVVDTADYILWRASLGTKITLPRLPGAAGAVPEPSALHLLCLTYPLILRELFGQRRRLHS